MRRLFTAALFQNYFVTVISFQVSLCANSYLKLKRWNKGDNTEMRRWLWLDRNINRQHYIAQSTLATTRLVEFAVDSLRVRPFQSC